MKRILKISTYFLSLFLLTAIIGLSTSCVNDEGLVGSITPGTGDGVVLQLSIKHNVDDVVSRGTTASAAELKINNGFIFVFDKATGAYIAHEQIELKNIAYPGGVASDPAVEATATPKITSELLDGLKIMNQRVVVVLNGTHVEYPLDRITYSNFDTKFELRGELSTERGLPMYGEIASWSNDTKEITIRRSVAKLMVQLSKNAAGTASAVAGVNGSDFTPATVSYAVFNGAISGHMKHVLTGVNYSSNNTSPLQTLADAALDNAKGAVLEGTNTGVHTSFLYEYPYATKIIGSSAGGEQTVATDKVDPNRLAIILKVATKTSGSRYYRLDLVNMQGEGGIINYLDVERNHQYRIVIHSVNDGGYPTAEAALKAAPSNIRYEIIDDTGNTTISNGMYAISVGEEFVQHAFNTTRTASTTSTPLANNVRFILSKNVASLPAGIENKIEALNLDGTLIPELTFSPASLTATAQELKVQWNGTALEEPKQYNIKITLGGLVYTLPTNFLLVQENEIKMELSSDFKFEYYGDKDASEQTVTISGPGSGATSQGEQYRWRASRTIYGDAGDKPVFRFGVNNITTPQIEVEGKSKDVLYTQAVRQVDSPDPILYTGIINIELVRSIDGAVIKQSKITKPLRVIGVMPYIVGMLYPYKSNGEAGTGIITAVYSSYLKIAMLPGNAAGSWHNVPCVTYNGFESPLRLYVAEVQILAVKNALAKWLQVGLEYRLDDDVQGASGSQNKWGYRRNADNSLSFGRIFGANAFVPRCTQCVYIRRL